MFSQMSSTVAIAARYLALDLFARALLLEAQTNQGAAARSIQSAAVASRGQGNASETVVVDGGR